MQYISLKPISLNLVHHTTLPHSSHNLALKLLLHIKDIPPQASGLHTSLNQINCAHELQTFFDREYNTFTRRRRARSVSERVRESANDTFKSLLSFILSLSAKILLFLAPLVLWVSLYAFMAQRLFAEICLLLVETGSPALKDILASAQQIDMRLQQTCYWPIQYITLQKRKRNWASITTNHSDYIRFYNSLWLVANDIIIGIALGTYLIDNGLQLALLLDRYSRRYAIESLYRTILWLMDWPAGLKLNNELAAFLVCLLLYFAHGCRITSDPAILSAHHHHHRRIRILGRLNVNLALLGFAINPDCPHLRFQYCGVANLPLAASHTHFPVPSLPRKEKERLAQQN
ncbi:N-acetylglucosaminyl-phosphatidylinositol biosynthetic protein gpi1 [Neolecta irregularis DAH-3]|uniref:N-acetylglucosaminyl-phosphatidylinositol biosynthetic protein gpi1 n=1 Tax=Neolecta irregularis (strain DAH-3) TaxID=1198029 RepID=A0A1U7LH46_NEOID|nr:N-acetylglucosaminyl-phosphatidylinositol biosynthetic protein gpi1 [Neolecta irregularis DAH-3]|eukprot:OLL21872.1 N-acetylglucosaminyl-phosphatidylinositol biosynthetic protein gpi1 [Neolecta irregularis DAH-3]